MVAATTEQVRSAPLYIPALTATTANNPREHHRRCVDPPLGPILRHRLIIHSRPPARPLVRDRPPCPVRIPQLVQTGHWRSTRARRWQDRQRRQFVWYPVRGGRKGQQDVVPRPQLHRGHVRYVQKGQRYVAPCSDHPMNRSDTLASPRTHDRVVSHRTQAQSVGSRDQRFIQAVYRQTRHGHRRRAPRHRRDPHGRLLRRRRDQGRTHVHSYHPPHVNDATFLGRDRDTQNVPPRSLRNRSRRGRGNRS
jgi:hypothetical protein